MSEEDFVSRWSRRKREAQVEAEPQAPARPADNAVEPPVDACDEPEIDLSSLPSIDSITAATDITAFLRKGIPQELTRAALRSAWSSDPTIRDFVGLAENAWDFNDPNAMPGFGPLDCSEAELSDLLERVVGGVRSAAESLITENKPAIPSETNSEPSSQSMIESNEQSVAEEATRPFAASQLDATQEPEFVSPVRRHGGALPKIAE